MSRRNQPDPLFVTLDRIWWIVAVACMALVLTMILYRPLLDWAVVNLPSLPFVGFGVAVLLWIYSSARSDMRRREASHD